jgi:tyrosyl-tRNA synthetase
VLNAFVRAGLVASNGEARRQVQSGGLRVNDVVVSDIGQILTEANATEAGAIKLSFGKKKHVLIRPA